MRANRKGKKGASTFFLSAGPILSSISLTTRITTAPSPPTPRTQTTTDDLFDLRTIDYKSNRTAFQTIINKYPEQFSPLQNLCPGLDLILGHMLVLRLGMKVDWTTEMKEWTDKDNRRVGRSMSTFVRMMQTGDAAVDA